MGPGIGEAGAAGIVPGFPRTGGAIVRGIHDKLHLGLQLYVSVDGAPRADASIGDLRPGTPLGTDTVMPWLSSGKPVGAVAIAQCWERGALELDDPVVRFIPEFAAGGKAAVTVRHLLTHTGGFRFGIRYQRNMSWDEIIASICAAPLEPGWIPGARAGYHTWTSWYILAEIVRRLDGRDYDRVVREAIFEPLGMVDSWIGLPAQAGQGYGDRFGILHETSGEGVRPSQADGEALGWPYRPGGSGRGPVRELGRFYEMLWAHGRWQGARIVSPQTVEALTARHRTGMLDETFQHVIDWGLGFILDSKMHGPDAPYGYGPFASSRTFGHSGSQSSCAFCDPVHGLVVAWVANGRPGEPRHQARARGLNAAIYEDLGLAGAGGVP